MAQGRPLRIDVVVPAHDEATLIGASIGALLDAREHALAAEPLLEVGVTIVLDACTDGSRSVVERFGGAVGLVEIDARNVGAARRAGIAATTDHSTGVPLDRRWIANTDADSRVPADWLEAHLRAFERGTDVLLGTVRPDFADLDAAGRSRWLLSHPPGHLPGNVHGANLGIRLDRYELLGGFASLAEHEDVDLVARARTAGLAVRATLDSPVVTSGRRTGRTPGGYAQFLARIYGPAPAGRGADRVTV
jgi:glycosyltransferase involved in cell wall biosynthesis